MKANNQTSIIEIIFFSFIAIVLTGMAIGQFTTAKADEQKAKEAYVYQVCNASRISPTISEGKCGDLQDETNTEFMCAEYNPDRDNYCWVESK